MSPRVDLQSLRKQRAPAPESDPQVDGLARDASGRPHYPRGK